MIPEASACTHSTRLSLVRDVMAAGLLRIEMAPLERPAHPRGPAARANARIQPLARPECNHPRTYAHILRPVAFVGPQHAVPGTISWHHPNYSSLHQHIHSCLCSVEGSRSKGDQTIAASTHHYGPRPSTRTRVPLTLAKISSILTSAPPLFGPRSSGQNSAQDEAPHPANAWERGAKSTTNEPGSQNAGGANCSAHENAGPDADHSAAPPLTRIPSRVSNRQ